MLIAELIEEGVAKLLKHGIDDGLIDTQMLLGYLLEMSRTQLYLHGAENVEPHHIAEFRSLINRRALREPVAYILGEREFWSLPFSVNRHVLIPRPETEFLLETVLQCIRSEDILIESCIDLCCGSGVIAVVLALELKTNVLALDCSKDALDVTCTNSRRHGVEDRVQPVASNLFSAIGIGKTFPLIVSNPPYVAKTELLGKLEPEVLDYEPHLALDGGDDGLDCIRLIAVDSLRVLSPGGLIFLEFGYDQGENIRNIFTGANADGRSFSEVVIYQDYSGRDRVLMARCTE